MPLLAAPVVPSGRWGVRAQPSLTADGLLLRPWAPADVPTVRAAYEDPAIRWWHARSMSDDDEALAWVDAKNAAWRDERAAEWAVTVAPAPTAPDMGAPSPAGRVPVLVPAPSVDHARTLVPTPSTAGHAPAPLTSGPVPRVVPPRHLAAPPLRRLGTAPTGTVVGRVALTHLNLYEGFGALAYWVVPAARGHRVAVRAGAEVLRWAFEELGLHRVEVEHSTRNDASCRVAELLGCRAEGVRRGHALHADGHHDMHLHARLRTDQP